jgi:hypothetical protein
VFFVRKHFDREKQKIMQWFKSGLSVQAAQHDLHALLFAGLLQALQGSAPSKPLPMVAIGQSVV